MASKEGFSDQTDLSSFEGFKEGRVQPASAMRALCHPDWSVGQGSPSSCADLQSENEARELVPEADGSLVASKITQETWAQHSLQLNYLQLGHVQGPPSLWTSNFV